MYTVLMLVLAGCVPQPASIALKGEPTIITYELKEIPLPAATVLDAKGVEINPAPVVTWAVTPTGIANLTDDSSAIVPVAEGVASVTATAGTATARFTLEVALPDAVEIRGITEAQELPMGDTVVMEAFVLDRGEAIEDLPVTWSTDHPEVATVQDGGRLITHGAGAVAITATGGGLTQTVNITVIAAAADEENGEAELNAEATG